jgi:hypothetical protein
LEAKIPTNYEAILKVAFDRSRATLIITMRKQYLALAAAVAISIVAACGGHHDVLPPQPESNSGDLLMSTSVATSSPAPPSLPATQLTLPDYATGGMIVAPNGALYLNGYSGFIRYSSGVFARYPYPVPAGASRVGGVDGQNTIAFGPSGTIWSTLYAGPCCPTTGGAFVARLTSSSVAESSGGAPPGDAFDTIAPDGLNHLWVVHQTGTVCSNARYDIWIFDSSFNVLRRLTLPTTSRLNAMTRGPDGLMYVATTLACGAGTAQIFQIDPSTFAIRKTVALASGSSVKELTAGPDGAVWFTNYARNSIGRLSSTGAVSNYPLPTIESFPTGITLGSDGALWFTEEISRSANHFKIGRITTAGAITEHLISYQGPFVQASEITAGIPGGARIPHTLYVLPRGTRILLKVTF